MPLTRQRGSRGGRRARSNHGKQHPHTRARGHHGSLRQLGGTLHLLVYLALAAAAIFLGCWPSLCVREEPQRAAARPANLSRQGGPPTQVTSASLNRKMEERGTDGVILSLEPSPPSLMTEVTGSYDYNYTYHGHWVMESIILRWLEVITDVIGLTGNAAVIWLLDFQIRRNAISVYILNLAVADFLYLCFHLIFSQDSFTLHFLSSKKYLLESSDFVFYYSYAVGLSFLSVISLERCLSVLCPILVPVPPSRTCMILHVCAGLGIITAISLFANLLLFIYLELVSVK
ncbi:mas-related G-protein coupled receptor member X3-like [Dipodomys merriami]|uniref:mas-related G-protein coupled receptor member X3-like n=1 Tax=Dipodomys merriami TaxID=94247 RepID=UPI0038560C0B